MKMKKIWTISLLMGFAAGISSASVVDFRNLTASAGGTTFVNGASAGGTINAAVASGDDLVYSFSITGADLDGGGEANDSLTWDVRFEAFTGSTYADGELTLGSSTQATVDDLEFSVDGNTWDANESVRFSVENVQLTADAGYTAAFNGFSGFWLTAGSYYLGTGVDTEEITTAGNADYAFAPAPSSLILTAQASERNRNLDGSFTVAIPEPATLGLVGAFGGGILFVRRRLCM